MLRMILHSECIGPFYGVIVPIGLLLLHRICSTIGHVEIFLTRGWHWCIVGATLSGSVCNGRC